MSKEVKNLIIEEYNRRFDGVEDALLVDIRALSANDNNALRQGLRGKNIRVTVVRNKLAAQAFGDGKLAALDPILQGPSALVYGESVVNVARELIDWAKKLQKMQVKGAVLDGQLFEGREGVERLSKFPTREEAIAQVVQVILSPAGSLVGAVLGPGGAIAGILKAIEEKASGGAESAA